MVTIDLGTRVIIKVNSTKIRKDQQPIEDVDIPLAPVALHSADKTASQYQAETPAVDGCTTIKETDPANNIVHADSLLSGPEGITYGSHNSEPVKKTSNQQVINMDGERNTTVHDVEEPLAWQQRIQILFLPPNSSEEQLAYGKASIDTIFSILVVDDTYVILLPAFAALQLPATLWNCEEGVFFSFLNYKNSGKQWKHEKHIHTVL